jgi:Zn-finger protein
LIFPLRKAPSSGIVREIVNKKSGVFIILLIQMLLPKPFLLNSIFKNFVKDKLFRCVLIYFSLYFCLDEDDSQMMDEKSDSLFQDCEKAVNIINEQIEQALLPVGSLMRFSMIGTKNDSKNEVIFVFLFFIQESRSQIYV